MPAYKSLLEKIFTAYPMYHKIGSKAYKEGLENIETLAEITGNPERKFQSIHIAGSNGKGSVANFLAAYCQQKGLKTGLYTSPHLVDFRERIRINGQMISENEVLVFFQTYQKQFDTIEPSFFEMTTMLAFDWFAKEKVDIAIIETGLGGRLDATNIITPILSIITNISLEHTHLLGDTVQKIAAEKAGIIKRGVPVVIGEIQEETLPVFEKAAQEKEAAIFIAEPSPLPDLSPYPLYQQKNLKTFFKAVDVLELFSPMLSANKCRDAINRVSTFIKTNIPIRGRWETISDNPLTICDVAHNMAGIKSVIEQLEKTDYEHLHFVIGLANDKDVNQILALLPKKRTTYYVCQADIERAMPAKELFEKMNLFGLHVVFNGTVFAAYCEAKKKAKKNDIILICGSCFVIGELFKRLEEEISANS